MRKAQLPEPAERMLTNADSPPSGGGSLFVSGPGSFSVSAIGFWAGFGRGVRKAWRSPGQGWVNTAAGIAACCPVAARSQAKADGEVTPDCYRTAAGVRMTPLTD